MTTSIDRNLIVIVGATGSGKTDLSIRVAQHFKAPILSADSRQLFKGMPIGTAQPTVEQLETVQHYFIATQELSTLYTCGQYEKEALELLGKLFLKYQVVVLVGGSGLYIDALCNGMDNLPASDPALRASLVERYEQYGLANLTEELRHLDPDYYSQVDLNNPNRVMRALEVCLQTGRPYSQQRSGRRIDRNFRIIKIGTHRPREILYERINRRVDQMMTEGLLKEARKLYPHRELNALQTVGYRELFDYFDGKCSLEQAVELIKRNTRRYAKRQMTWFGRDESIRWLDPDDPVSILTYLDQQCSSSKT